MSTLEAIKDVQRTLGLEPDGYAGPVTWAAIRKQIVGNAAPPAAPPTFDAEQLDERTRNCIATLHPEVQKRALAFVKEVRNRGLDVRIISGTRSYQEQNALYAQGRSAPGPRVTNAPAGYSNHNFGLAFDVGIFRNGRYLDDGREYREIAPIGKAHGFTWGGDWQSIQDEPHYELRPYWAANLSESQMLAELRRRKEDGRDALV